MQKHTSVIISAIFILFPLTVFGQMFGYPDGIDGDFAQVRYQRESSAPDPFAVNDQYSPGYANEYIQGETPALGTSGPLPPHYLMESGTSSRHYGFGSDSIPVDPTFNPNRTNHFCENYTAPSMNSNWNVYQVAEKQKGFVRDAAVSGTWAPKMGNGSNNLNMYQGDAKITVAAPMKPLLGENSYIALSPGFQYYRFEWEHDTEISKDLYTASLMVALGKRFGNQYELTFGISPAYSSDFKTSSSDAWKWPVFAKMLWRCNPRLEFTIGATYLDRDDVPFLPIVGFVWRPTDDLYFEIMLPRPRIAKRIHWWGSQVGNRVSDWIYVGGEIAGGSWAVEVPSRNSSGTLEYYDFRAMVGFERKILNTASFGVEVGYIFGREFSEPHVSGEYKPDGAPFVRAKIVY